MKVHFRRSGSSGTNTISYSRETEKRPFPNGWTLLITPAYYESALPQVRFFTARGVYLHHITTPIIGKYLAWMVLLIMNVWHHYLFWLIGQPWGWQRPKQCSNLTKMTWLVSGRPEIWTLAGSADGKTFTPGHQIIRILLHISQMLQHPSIPREGT